ncbi:MAG TPA: hypothetical protein VIK81_02380 [Patescibacteria group bacterium]
MFWLIPALLRISTENVISPVLIKIFSKLPSTSVRLTYQFFFCFTFSLLIFLFAPDNLLNKNVLIVMLFGFMNAFAAYAQWKAYNLNLSGSMIFNPLSGLISLGLGYVFLKEFEYLNLPLITGIIFIFLVSFLSVMRQITGYRSNINLDLFKWTVFYSLIWGLETFVTRIFAIGGMPIINFVTAFYLGSLSGGILLSKGFIINKVNNILAYRDIKNIFILSIFIWLSLVLNYFSLKLAPITVIVPIFQLSGLILPFLIGALFFKEVKKINRFDFVVLLFGIVGGLLIILSYQV